MKGHSHHSAHGHMGGHHQGHHGHQGHMAVVVKKHGGKVEHRAEGGPVMEKEPGKKFVNRGRDEEMIEEEEKGHKRGGHVKGHMPKMRADRRARGGRMTPKEPFSGADGPNPPYARSHEPKPGTEGKGTTVRP